MSEDFCNEVEAIRSIYGDDGLQFTNETGIYVLSIPSYSFRLRLHFPPTYPANPPEILGTDTIGEGTTKGYGCYVLQFARDILQKVWKEGEVCLFDLIEELETALSHEKETLPSVKGTSQLIEPPEGVDASLSAPTSHPSDPAPGWTLSTPITEKKSLFIA
ncbi:eIF2 kinase Gcn2p negative regulator, partial [Schaereria dolodes]|nr:eIF2 kinase Gcn2p negative regulator [Schaereria dolodes]